MPNTQHTRIVITFLALLLATTLAVRLWEKTGWGISEPDSDEKVRYGCLSNPSDYLCYLAFAEQSRAGALLFENLYTTDSQRPALFNLFFQFVGKTAHLIGSTSIAYNLLGTLGACIAMIATLRCAQILGLGLLGQACVGALLLWGSGLSWLHYIVGELHGLKIPVGTDVSFGDLVPAFAFQIYPLHSFAFGITASLLMLILRAESELRKSSVTRPTLILSLASLALVLGLTRPYEPIAFTLVYSCYCAAMTVSEGPRAIKSRLPIIVVIALGFAPGLLYNMWVAHQPVWSNFARDAAALTAPKIYSIIGFGILWFPAVIGAAITWTRAAPSWRLLTIWTVFVMLLMLVFNTGRIKLAGGSFIALALLNGRALESLWQARKVEGSLRTAGLRWSVILSLALGFPTVPLFFASARTEIPEIDSELLALKEKIRSSTDTRSPAVLAPADAGAVFVGLAGFHTFAGQWSLTPDFRNKVLRLDEIGFGKPGLAATDIDQRLRELLRDSHAEFVVVKSTAPVLPYLLKNQSLLPLEELSRWSCFKVLPQP